MTSDNYVKALVRICLNTGTNSIHIDYNDSQNLNIHEVENYGQTGTIQLINNVNDGNRNLLSSSCNLWSDGKRRKIDRAMYLRVFHTSRDDNNIIGTYLITDITASGDLLTLTFCDSVQFLRSQGPDYVRNFSQTVPTWKKHRTGWDMQNNCGYIECPDGFMPHGGGYGDVAFNKRIDDYHNQRDTYYGLDANWPGSYVRFRVNNVGDNDLSYINKITINNVSLTAGVYISAEHPLKADIYVATASGESRVGEFVMSSREQTTISVDFGDSPLMASGKWVEIKVQLTLSPTPAGPKTLSFGCQNNVEGHTVWTYSAFDKSTRQYDNCAFTAEIIMAYRSDNVYGAEYGTFSPKRWKIDSIAGKEIKIDEFNYNWFGKAELYYVDPSSAIKAVDIFDNILQAFGYSMLTYGINSRMVNQFRCNGDFVHNYLLALADMPNSDNKQFAFRSLRSAWGIIVVGYRYKNTDTSQKTLKYSKDAGDGISFLTFNPSISLKNRPKLAIVKGTDSNDKPIMVAVTDPNVPYGATIPTVNGSIANVVEGALSTYSDVITNRSENWQGEIKLSGIDLTYMMSGEYVGGVPITINDSRYGFSNYRAKVREVKYDFANQTTTLMINNYSEMYSNSILDTNKMAYNAGDLSAEATNIDMFCRQFLYLDFTNIQCSGDPHDVEFYVTNGENGRITNATVIDFPELNIKVINAYFPRGKEGGWTTDQYGVSSVRIGNMTHGISAPRRPDKLEGQSLIINIIYRLN